MKLTCKELPIQETFSDHSSPQASALFWTPLNIIIIWLVQPSYYSQSTDELIVPEQLRDLSKALMCSTCSLCWSYFPHLVPKFPRDEWDFSFSTHSLLVNNFAHLNCPVEADNLLTVLGLVQGQRPALWPTVQTLHPERLRVFSIASSSCSCAASFGEAAAFRLQEGMCILFANSPCLLQRHYPQDTPRWGALKMGEVYSNRGLGWGLLPQWKSGNIDLFFSMSHLLKQEIINKPQFSSWGNFSSFSKELWPCQEKAMRVRSQ